MAMKALGQSAPSATTATTLYAVPEGYSAVVSTVALCNRGTADVSVRLAHRPGAATLADEHYVLYDALITAGSTLSVTWGICMESTDVLTVYASAATLSATAWGDES